MPNATGRDLHVNVPLSNVAINYRPMGLIADMVAPIVMVNKQSDSFYVFSAADAFRTEDDTRAPGTEPNKITTSITSDTYFAYNYALMDNIPYEDIENADAGVLLTERNARVMRITDKLFLNWEYRLAEKCTSTSNVGSSSAVASAWTDYTAGNSDPIGNINTGINNVQDLTGYRPNSILFSGTAWRNFREHDDVIDRIYGSMSAGKARTANIEQTKALFEIDRITVGRGYRNTTQEGQTKSLTEIWGDHVLVYYAPMAPRKDVPSFMYSFRWNKLMPMQAKVRQDEATESEEIRVGYYQDEKITASDLSFLITNVTSSS